MRSLHNSSSGLKNQLTFSFPIDILIKLLICKLFVVIAFIEKHFFHSFVVIAIKKEEEIDKKKLIMKIILTC